MDLKKANLDVVFPQMLDNFAFFPSDVHEILNPEAKKNFNRIERGRKVPSRKVQKGFDNMKEDLHTL